MQPALAQPDCQDPDAVPPDPEEEPAPGGEPAEEPAQEPDSLEDGTEVDECDDGGDDDECDGDATPYMLVSIDSGDEEDGSGETSYPGSTDAVTGSPPPSLSSPEASQVLKDVENSTKASNEETVQKKRDQMEKRVLSRQATLPALTDTANSQDLENLSEQELAELKKQPLQPPQYPRVDGKCRKHDERLSSASASVVASSKLASGDQAGSVEDPVAKCARLEAELQELRRLQTAKILGLNLIGYWDIFLIYLCPCACISYSWNFFKTLYDWIC